MLKLLLAASILLLATAKLGVTVDFNPLFPLKPAEIDCYKKQNVEFFAIDLYLVDNTLNKNFTTMYTMLQQAGVNQIDATVFFCGAIIPTPKNFTEQIRGALPAGFNGTIWFVVESGIYALCWVKPFDVGFLAMVELYAATLKLEGFKVGILTDSTWNTLLNASQIKKSPLITRLPLWYQKNDNSPSFNDYNSTTQIGEWVQPTKKMYTERTKRVCSHDIAWSYAPSTEKKLEWFYL